MVNPHPRWDRAASHATFLDGSYCQSYQCIELQKHAADLERYRLAVAMSGAQVIVETGTRTGGSALWFHYELGLEVISIDVAPQFVAAIGPPHRGAGITFLIGSSTSPDAVQETWDRIGDRRVMVSLDSDHHAPHVLAEIGYYAEMVTPGCHLVVEDGCFDLFGDPDGRRGGTQIPEVGGPLRAIDQAGLECSATWQRDLGIEGTDPISHSPGGWWRKRA